MSTPQQTTFDAGLECTESEHEIDFQDQWIGPEHCLNGQKHQIEEATMREDGIDYPITKCKICGMWG